MFQMDAVRDQHYQEKGKKEGKGVLQAEGIADPGTGIFDLHMVNGKTDNTHGEEREGCQYPKGEGSFMFDQLGIKCCFKTVHNSLVLNDFKEGGFQIATFRMDFIYLNT